MLLIVGPKPLTRQIKSTITKRILPETVFGSILQGDTTTDVLKQITFPTFKMEIILVYILLDGYDWPYSINISNIICTLFKIKTKFIFKYKGEMNRQSKTMNKLNYILRKNNY